MNEKVEEPQKQERCGGGSGGAKEGMHVGDQPMRSVKVRYQGQERTIGCVPARLYNDVNTVVLYIKKGKRSKLSAQRMHAVDTALKACPGIGGISGLVQRFAEWKRQGAAKFNASEHYNEERAKAYTTWNATSQENLALAALAWLKTEPLHRDRLGTSALWLDVGCGTGLSSKAISKPDPAPRAKHKRRTRAYAGSTEKAEAEKQQHRSEPRQQQPLSGPQVIGIDVSQSMLEQRVPGSALDAVRCSFTQPLPFRDDAFDAAFGVASVHFLNTATTMTASTATTLSCAEPTTAAATTPTTAGGNTTTTTTTFTTADTHGSAHTQPSSSTAACKHGGLASAPQHQQHQEQQQPGAALLPVHDKVVEQQRRAFFASLHSALTPPASASGEAVPSAHHPCCGVSENGRQEGERDRKRSKCSDASMPYASADTAVTEMEQTTTAHTAGALAMAPSSQTTTSARARGQATAVDDAAACCFQLFPQQGREMEELEALCATARGCGFTGAFFFAAWPHRTAAPRWYLHVSHSTSQGQTSACEREDHTPHGATTATYKQRSSQHGRQPPLLSHSLSLDTLQQPPSCALLWLETGHNAACLLSARGWRHLHIGRNSSTSAGATRGAAASDSLWHWHRVQHCKFARKLVRTLSWQAREGADSTRTPAATGEAAPMMVRDAGRGSPDAQSWSACEGSTPSNPSLPQPKGPTPWKRKHKGKDKGMKPLTGAAMQVAVRLRCAMGTQATLEEYVHAYTAIIHPILHA